MVFKRRDKPPFWRRIAEALWPKSGWSRALLYIKHRLWRLPDPPHRIARGIFAGITVTFTPFFGLHFLLAAGLAWVLRGNIVAALLATFFGNPVTFVPIAAISLNLGNFILGKSWAAKEDLETSVGVHFLNAWRDLRDNFLTIFTDDRADWTRLVEFYSDVFLPYLIGGLVPGTIVGLIGYYLTLPVIQAYKNRRKGRLKERWNSLKEKAAATAAARKQKKQGLSDDGPT